MAIPVVLNNPAVNPAGTNDTAVQQAWQQAIDQILIPAIAGMTINSMEQTMQLGQKIAAKLREDQQS